MITEDELDAALQLQKEIKELKILIAKFEEAKISRTSTMNAGVSFDSNKIEVNDYTQILLQKFKEDIVHVYKVKLQDLKEKYAEIIESPEDTLMRIVKENG